MAGARGVPTEPFPVRFIARAAIVFSDVRWPARENRGQYSGYRNCRPTRSVRPFQGAQLSDSECRARSNRERPMASIVSGNGGGGRINRRAYFKNAQFAEFSDNSNVDDALLLSSSLRYCSFFLSGLYFAVFVSAKALPPLPLVVLLLLLFRCIYIYVFVVSAVTAPPLTENIAAV